MRGFIGLLLAILVMAQSGLFAKREVTFEWLGDPLEVSIMDFSSDGTVMCVNIVYEGALWDKEGVSMLEHLEGDDFCYAQAINSSGTIIVGSSSPILPYWDEKTRIFVTIGWLMFLLLDTSHIMFALKKDEREK